MFNYDNDYLNLIHIQKAVVNSNKQKITYYFDGGKIETQTFADSSDFDEKVDAISSSFLEIDGIYYNANRIGIVVPNAYKVDFYFLGGKVINETYETTDEVAEVVEFIDSTHIEINGKYYNGSQLHIARSDENTLTVEYEWLGREVHTVVYEDESAYSAAIEKLTDLNEGGSGGGGSGTRTATPTFSVTPGAVDVGTKVTISCSTEGATIHYTTDGTDATLSSPTYVAGTEITVPEGGITIKAVAVILGLATSRQATGAYTIYVGPAKRYSGWYMSAESAPFGLTATDIKGLSNLVTDELTTCDSPDPFIHVAPAGADDGCHVVWCYPASYGECNYFTDGLGKHALLDSFTKEELTINDVEYIAYILTDPIAPDEGDEYPMVFTAE